MWVVGWDGWCGCRWWGGVGCGVCGRWVGGGLGCGCWVGGGSGLVGVGGELVVGV